jgi:hypothetical protein
MAFIVPCNKQCPLRSEVMVQRGGSFVHYCLRAARLEQDPPEDEQGQCLWFKGVQ